MGRWSRLLTRLLLDFAAVPDRGRMLDIGSGTGNLTTTIARVLSHVHVVGLDPSREFVAYAASRNAFPERVDFQVGDARDLPFADETFLACLSLLAFNFIPDREKALREAIRVTEPAGTISAAVWDYGGLMPMLRAFWDAAVRTDASAERLDERHLPLCRAGELSEFWNRIGLENVREQALDITMRFDSFADYWEPFLLGQGPAGAYVRTVPADRLPILRDAVKRNLALSSDDESFALPARAWAVRGMVPIHW